MTESTMARRDRVAGIVRAVLDANGGQATPRQVEVVLDAAGYSESEVRRAFDTLSLVAVSDPHGKIVWTRRR